MRYLMLSLSAALLLLCGCRTSTLRSTPAFPGQLTSTGKPAACNLEAENWGFFLFNWLPLVTGNPNHPNTGDYDVAVNWMNTAYLERNLREEAERRGAGPVEDFRLNRRSTGLFSLWLVWLRVENLKGVAPVAAP